MQLPEKGGKRHKMPCHHNFETYLHAYLDGGGIAADPKGPLFRTIGRTTGQLTTTPLPQANAHAMTVSVLSQNGIVLAKAAVPSR